MINGDESMPQNDEEEISGRSKKRMLSGLHIDELTEAGSIIKSAMMTPKASSSRELKLLKFDHTQKTPQDVQQCKNQQACTTSQLSKNMKNNINMIFNRDYVRPKCGGSIITAKSAIKQPKMAVQACVQQIKTAAAKPHNFEVRNRAGSLSKDHSKQHTSTHLNTNSDFSYKGASNKGSKQVISSFKKQESSHINSVSSLKYIKKVCSKDKVSRKSPSKIRLSKNELIQPPGLTTTRSTGSFINPESANNEERPVPLVGLLKLHETSEYKPSSFQKEFMARSVYQMQKFIPQSQGGSPTHKQSSFKPECSTSTVRSTSGVRTKKYIPKATESSASIKRFCEDSYLQKPAVPSKYSKFGKKNLQLNTSLEQKLVRCSELNIEEPALNSVSSKRISSHKSSAKTHNTESQQKSFKFNESSSNTVILEGKSLGQATSEIHSPLNKPKKSSYKKQGPGNEAEEKASKLCKLNNMLKMIEFLEKDQELTLDKIAFRKRMQDFKEESNKKNHNCLDNIPNEYHELLPKYTVDKTLGQGSFGEVKLGIDAEQTRYAIKIYNNAKVEEKKLKKAIVSELSLLQSLDHKHIAKVFEYIQGKRYSYIVMEYCGPVNLREYLNTTENSYICEQEAALIFSDLAKALVYLHSKNIYHRDIKLDNIMVCNPGIVKLVDFGLAVKLKENVVLNSYCGTPSYMSPEILSKKKYFADKADVWSFGICLYRVLVGNFPFRGVDEANLTHLVKKGEIEWPDRLSSECQILLLALLAPNPNKRPSVSEILKFNWFMKNEHLESTVDSIRK